MRHYSIILTLILLAATFGMLMAQGNLGQSGANFLQIAVEPRGAALGGGGVALAEGAAALYWNPAGAIYTENFDINLSYTNWFLDTKLAYGAVTKNFGSLGTFGLSVTSFYMDDMEITTVYASEGTGEYYTAGDIAIGLSYARSLTDRFTFGVTAKYVQEKIWNETANQIALDIGSLYKTDFYNLRIGMSVRNFAGKMKFSGDDIDQRIKEEEERQQAGNPRIERLTPEFRLPQTFQLGVAFDPITAENWNLTFISDVDVPNDNEERVIFAMEYEFQNFAYLRGAYRLNYDEGSYSLGGGLDIKLSGVNSRLDYSFSTHGLLGDVHRFGFGISL